MSSWYVWSIDQKRYGKVREFLLDLNEVEDILYPVVEKEYITKKGKKTKNVPVYSNYIFIKYDHSSATDVKIQRCQWIKHYVGPCTDEEIKNINLMNGKDYDDVMPNDYGIKVGMNVSLKSNGFLASVIDIKGDNVILAINIFGQNRTFSYNIEDIEIYD